MSKYILTPLALEVETRQWAVQKGAQHQNTSGRGCAWYAGAILCHFWYHSGLHNCSAVDRGLPSEYLLADRGYDTDAIILKAADEGMTPVIPPKKNRKELREYDEYLYKLRHLVENAFLLLKRWRGIATRYAKNVASFVAAVQIRCIAIWLLIY